MVQFFHRASLILGLGWLVAFWLAEVYEPVGKLATVLRLVLIAPYLPFFALGVLGAQLAKGRKQFSRAFELQILMACLVVFSQASDASPYLFGAVTLLPVLVTFWLIMMFHAYIEGWRLPHIAFVTPSLTQIGLMSYSWYLLHENLGYVVLRALTSTLGFGVSIGIAVIATGLAAFVFSYACEWRFRAVAERSADKVLAYVAALLPKKMGERMV